MNIAKIQLKGYRLVIVLCFLAGTALFAIRHFTFGFLPPGQSHVFTISFSNNSPNNTPQIIESKITSLLESSLSQIAGLKNITSVSGNNYGVITLDFDKSITPDYKKLELVSAIRSLYKHLPPGTSFPNINYSNTKNDESNQPLLVYTLSSVNDNRQLQTCEAAIRKSLTGLEGIKELKFPQEETWQIKLLFDKDKCDAYGISPQNIADALTQKYNFALTGAFISTQYRSYSITIPQPVLSVDEIKSVVIRTINKTPVSVSDIAEVFPEQKKASSYFRINGVAINSLIIYARRGANNIELCAAIRDKIESMPDADKKKFGLTVSYNSTQYQVTALKSFLLRMAILVCLALVILKIFFRHWGYMMVALLSMIACYAVVVIALSVSKTELNLYSLEALYLSVLFIFFNTFIVIHLNQQRNYKNTIPLLFAFSSITVLALFIHLCFGVHALENNSFAGIFTLALASHLLVHLFFFPGLCQMFITAPVLTGKKTYSGPAYIVYLRFITKLYVLRKWVIATTVLAWGIPLFLLPENKTIGSDYYTQEIRPILDKATGGILRLFVQKAAEGAEDKKPEKTRLMAEARLPFETDANEVSLILSDFERYLSKLRPAIKYITRVNDGLSGSIEITFDPQAENSMLPSMVKSGLVDLATNRGGIEWNIYGTGKSYENRLSKIPGFRILLTAPDYNGIETLTQNVVNKLKQNERVQKITLDDRYNLLRQGDDELEIQLNQPLLSMAGISPAYIATGLHDLVVPLSIPAAGTYNGRKLPVMVKNNSPNDISAGNLLNTPLHMPERIFRTKDYGQLVTKEKVKTIYKDNRQFVRVISLDFIGTNALGESWLNEVLGKISETVPAGYRLKIQYPEPETDLTNYTLFKKAGLLLAVILIIGAVFLEDVKTPLKLMLVLPVSVSGVLLTFLLSDFQIDQGAFAAMIITAAVTANYSLMVADAVRQQKEPGETPDSTLLNLILNKATLFIACSLLLCCGFICHFIAGNKTDFWISFSAGAVGGALFSLIAVFLYLPLVLGNKAGLHINN